MPEPQHSDEHIARMVQRGDRDAFGMLVERYEQKMIRYARRFLLGREDAEDLIQQVFLNAYTNIQGFDTTRSFSSWMYRIAHNAFVNALKKQNRSPLLFFDPDTIFPHPTSKETADRAQIEQEIKRAIDKGLEALPLKYRESLILFYLEELSYKEIAEILHIPVATVGVRLNRGRQLLKKNIQY